MDMSTKQKANILYVDDEPNNLVTFAAAFRREYNIFTADSARKGIEILMQKDIQLILTDQRMPEMTGIQFLEAIIPEFPNAVRMIVTGFSDVEVIIKAINTGRVFRYITKPWDESELHAIIESGLSHYNLEERNRRLIEELNEQVIEHKRTMALFQKYVPASILNEVLSNTSTTSLLEGERRIVSVLFADIRNFTKLSAAVKDPLQTVRYLNNYYTFMSEIIQKHGGVINKYLGDRILALFGAPVSHIDNQLNAVLAGMEMIESLERFNAEDHNCIGQNIEIGIGINTGEVIAGNIGTPDRIEYTALGDTVNVASRLEDLTVTMPNTLLITESTYQCVKDKVYVEKMGPMALRGNEDLFNVFKVTGKVPVIPA